MFCQKAFSVAGGYARYVPTGLLSVWTVRSVAVSIERECLAKSSSKHFEDTREIPVLPKAETTDVIGEMSVNSSFIGRLCIYRVSQRLLALHTLQSRHLSCSEVWHLLFQNGIFVGCDVDQVEPKALGVNLLKTAGLKEYRIAATSVSIRDPAVWHAFLPDNKHWSGIGHVLHHHARSPPCSETL